MAHPNSQELSQWKADVATWSDASIAWAQENIIRLDNNQGIGSNPPPPPPPPPGLSYDE